jgi:hypothetical protein
MSLTLAGHPIFEWQNLIFVLPMVVAGLLIVLQASGLDGDHEAGHDHDIHHDPGPDLHHGSDGWKLLSLFGVGKVPVTVLFVSALLLWGAGGLVGNFIVSAGPLVAMIVAGGSALLGTRFLAISIARVMPSLETSGESPEWFEEREATVLFPLTDDTGAVSIKNREGMTVQLQARVESGHAEIPEGAVVVLQRYSRERQCYMARPQFGGSSKAEATSATG